jgi:hypothetical protein
MVKVSSLKQRCASVLVCVLLLGASSAAAAVTMAELGVSPFPRSERVQSSRGAEAVSHEFVLGSVERVRGQVRVSEAARVRGLLSSATYEAPRGSGLEEVIAHYRQRLLADGASSLFECRGRDCGRSNLWANQIFGQAILYGPDRDQYYLSVKRDNGPHGELLGIYVIERGNNRVYAHLEQVTLEEPLVLDVTAVQLENLQRHGYARVADLPYDMRGALPEAVRDQVAGYADRLGTFPRGQLHLVCHLYGAAPAADLIERSNQCAQQARSVLDPEGRLDIATFGAGPLAPRNGRADSRIELVIPGRLERP